MNLNLRYRGVNFSTSPKELIKALGEFKTAYIDPLMVIVRAKFAEMAARHTENKDIVVRDPSREVSADRMAATDHEEPEIAAKIDIDDLPAAREPDCDD